jgi:hypothetical protein
MLGCCIEQRGKWMIFPAMDHGAAGVGMGMAEVKSVSSSSVRNSLIPLF